jgi:uncharacterized membrane protein (UPF0182 family)
VVSFNDQIEMRDSLGEALDAVFGSGTGAAVDQPVVDPGDDGGTPVDVPDEVAALVIAAEQALNDAEAALMDGDLGTYADKVVEAQDLIGRVTALLATDTEG